MDPITILVAVAAVVAFLLWKQRGLLSPEAAKGYLKQGAKVVDVRSAPEFGADHIKQAINIPLGQLEVEAERRFPNKDQVILVHCLSGTRSQAAKRVLTRMGYAEVHNLGGIGRARRLLRSR